VSRRAHVLNARLVFMVSAFLGEHFCTRSIEKARVYV
jgi:hypothetical protein